jgi:hypothetical protein
VVEDEPAEDEDESARSAAIHAAIVADELYLIQRIFASSDVRLHRALRRPGVLFTDADPLMSASSRSFL